MMRVRRVMVMFLQYTSVLQKQPQLQPTADNDVLVFP